MKRQWLILIGVVAFVFILGVGAVAGGAVAYFLLQDDGPAALAESRLKTPQVDTVGILVSEVKEGGPADQAGLERGDIILSVGNQEVNTFGEFKYALQGYNPGDEVTMTVQHGDDERTLTVVLDEREGNAFLGISTCMVPMIEGKYPKFYPDEFEKQFEIHLPGTLITKVVDGSPAGRAGIQVEDRILSVDGEKVSINSSLADLIQAYMPGDSVELKIARDGEKLDLTVNLGEHPEITGKAYLGVEYQMVGPGMRFDSEEGQDFFFMPHHDFKGEIPFEDAPFNDMPFFDEDMPGMDHYDLLPEGYQTALIIGDVLEGTPAEEARLEKDDLILELNGDPVEDVDGFVKTISELEPGDRVDLLVYREKETVDVVVELGQHPDNPENGYLGIMVAGFVNITIEGEFPDDFDFDLKKELELPGIDA